MENGKWKISIPVSTSRGPRTTDHGHELRTTDHGLRTTDVFSLPAVRPLSSICHLLELFPLLGCEHRLQPLVRILAHLTKLRFRLFAQLSQLLSCVFKYSAYLGPLILS